MITRFFHFDDGVSWYVVAVDPDHAKNILRKSGCEFGEDAKPFDQVDVAIHELTQAEADDLWCGGDRPGFLGGKEIGTYWCTEW